MFYGPNQIIDNVQAIKRQFVTVFVQDPVVSQELIKVIDAQTDFYKTSANAMLGLASVAIQNSTPKK